jgi:hypothetical protein
VSENGDSRQALVQVAMPTRGCAYAPSLLWAADVARSCGLELRLEMGRPVELVRTRIVKAFLGTAATHLLMIDDDILPPAGALERLLALDAPVATAPCPIFVDGRIVANVKAEGTDAWIEAPSRLAFRVSQTGLGLTLIRRDVFERIRTPWFQFGASSGGRAIGEDTWFSNGVTQAGLAIVCDGTVRCSHVKDGLDLLAVARWGD